VKSGDLLLIDWGTGFGLFRSKNVRLVTPGIGWCRLRKPVHYKGKVYRFAVFCGEAKDNGKLRPTRLLAAATTEAEARGECERLLKAGRDQEAKGQTLCAALPVTIPDIRDAQLKVLGQVYPATMRALKMLATATNDTERDRLRLVAESTYKAEAFAQTNILPDGEADDATRRLLEKALRRKRRWFDAVGYELALNWIRKGYCRMKRRELAEAIYKATGKRLSPDTASKRAERIGLVTTGDVKPGPRPRVEK